eukprot:Sspe_Gene.5092::Locus_1676_Transcript_1_1_Confidence_1.000_Length_3330::g.5092::m.5092
MLRIFSYMACPRAISAALSSMRLPQLLDLVDEGLLLRGEALHVVVPDLLRCSIRLRVEQFDAVVADRPHHVPVRTALHLAHVGHDRPSVFRELGHLPRVPPRKGPRGVPHPDDTVHPTGPHVVVGLEQTELRALTELNVHRGEEGRDGHTPLAVPHLDVAVQPRREEVLAVHHKGPDALLVRLTWEPTRVDTLTPLTEVVSTKVAVVVPSVQQPTVLPIKWLVRDTPHCVAHWGHTRLVGVQLSGVLVDGVEDPVAPRPQEDLPVTPSGEDTPHHGVPEGVDGHLVPHSNHAGHRTGVLLHFSNNLKVGLSRRRQVLHRHVAVPGQGLLDLPGAPHFLTIDVGDDHPLAEPCHLRWGQSLHPPDGARVADKGDGHLPWLRKDAQRRIGCLTVHSDVPVAETSVHVPPVVQEARDEHLLLLLKGAQHLTRCRIADGQRTVLLGGPHPQLLKWAPPVEDLHAANLPIEVPLVQNASLHRLKHQVVILVLHRPLPTGRSIGLRMVLRPELRVCHTGQKRHGGFLAVCAINEVQRLL